ncbi:MAG TPA: hypothetical protein VFV81_05765 [Verrucomicrobiae bacterium]|nr:hypothetical protein [Verrucomicrobiae bacterium]
MPGRVRTVFGLRLHTGLLFVALVTDGIAKPSQGGQPGGFIEPAGDDGSRAKAGRFAREDDEDRLDHIFGVMRPAGEPQGD